MLLLISSYEYTKSTMAPVMAPTIDTTDEVSPKELGYVCNPYRYAGYEYLEQIGIYDLNARYYDPEIARFLSADPYYDLGNRVIGLYEINVPTAASIMQANNVYAYCGNSPILFIDPFGLREVAYVIYDSTEKFMENQAKDEYDKMEDEYDEIHILSVEDKESFINTWNSIGIDENGDVFNIDKVIIISHASPDSLSFGGESVSKSNISSLDVKHIDTLYISACNAGHLDKKYNVSFHFTERQDVEEVISWDGTIFYFDPGITHGWDALSFDQGAFEKYAPYVMTTIRRQGYEFSYRVHRRPVGKVVYTKNDDGVIVRTWNDGKNTDNVALPSNT